MGKSADMDSKSNLLRLPARTSAPANSNAA